MSDDLAGSGCEQLIPTEERKSLEEIEKSLKKKFRKPLWSKFTKAIREYQLLQPGDKVAVAISGGKDSLLMAKLFQELQRQRQVELELEFIAMDPGYHPNIKELLIDNCKHLQIPLHIFEADIFKIAQKIAGDYPCYMCAKMRRGALYTKAQELGCNKLALGHHFDDVIETTMLNLLCAGSFKNMLPKLKAKNFAGMELIRPLYLIKEKDISRFTGYCGIWPLNCACMVAAKKIGNKRYEIKALIEDLRENFQEVEKSIFRAGHNVYLDSILGWKKDGEHNSYLDHYDDE
ncbi:tRNA 2-thiocytidine biosynthesis TtcA family protein [Dethiobacter alkaliphilus]|uniref:tRNA 2-thiocytidine biosynthesis TtcA family protein n=1 Tax=Dethiobacter alkaliphilus TaxID=427926 RepID=UPI0022280505|nr:ATP-binding protein [Dethiobacter alkaliphilus]MCW3488511.1 tRNA 2-thiocytidine biosynthesis protein TtcA [Dethiobacter alkaliphilus]